MTQRNSSSYEWQDYGSGLTLVDANNNRSVSLMSSPKGLLTWDKDIKRNRPIKEDDNICRLISAAPLMLEEIEDFILDYKNGLQPCISRLEKVAAIHKAEGK